MASCTTRTASFCPASARRRVLSDSIAVARPVRPSGRCSSTTGSFAIDLRGRGGDSVASILFIECVLRRFNQEPQTAFAVCFVGSDGVRQQRKLPCHFVMHELLGTRSAQRIE